jgi:hypothetical protein
MKKIWQIFLMILLMVFIFLIPAIFGGIVANAGASCEPTSAWLEWLKLCVVGSYVMLTLNGLGMLALIAIAAIVWRIIYIIKH